MNCLKCCHLHLHGYGYSDYTWEGSEMTCALGKFKEIDDDTAGKKSIADIAEKCEKFDEGLPFETTPELNVHAGEQIEKCSKCEDKYE